VVVGRLLRPPRLFTEYDYYHILSTESAQKKGHPQGQALPFRGQGLVLCA